jgi:hypothetical protein
MQRPAGVAGVGALFAISFDKMAQAALAGALPLTLALTGAMAASFVLAVFVSRLQQSGEATGLTEVPR